MKKKLLLLIFPLISSCGKRIDEKESDSVFLESAPKGVYSAILMPVNSRISNQVYGDVKISRYEDDFNVSVKLRDAPLGNLRQSLHTGFICPKNEMDLNGDGYIDISESSIGIGPVIVPLDGDLSSQFSGIDYSMQGDYSYKKSTSYYLMLADLHLPDEVINDSITKMRSNDLILERKVVVISLERFGLPNSVRGEEIPVACGILTKISDNPGEYNDDYWNEEYDEVNSEALRGSGTRSEPVMDSTPNEATVERRSWRSRWQRWRDRVNDWFRRSDRHIK